MWREWIAVAAGGMIGSLARYGLNLAFLSLGPAWLPLATFSANVLGCLAIGWLFQWSTSHQVGDHWWVIGLKVGVLGGLTTFSTFALEVVRLWQIERTATSIFLAASHLIIGLAAVVAGMALAGK